MKARGQYPWQPELCFIQLSALTYQGLGCYAPRVDIALELNEWTSLLGLVHIDEVEYRLGSFHQNQIELFIMIKGGLLYTTKLKPEEVLGDCISTYCVSASFAGAASTSTSLSTLP